MNNTTNTTTRSTGDVIEESGTVRVSVDDLMPANTGILSTARNAVTNAPPASLNEKTTLVDYQGIQISLGEAIRHGLVTRDAAGNYSDAGGAAVAEPALVEQSADDDENTPQAFAPAQEAALSDFVGQLHPTVQMAIVEQLTRTGGLENLDMAQAASSGMNAGQFKESIGATVAMFQSQADAHVTAKGCTPSEFYEWARSNEPAEIQRAMREHALRRSPAVYNALIEKFTHSTVPSAEALTRGGIKTSTTRGVSGAADTDMVTIGGLTMSAKVAARIGLI